MPTTRYTAAKGAEDPQPRRCRPTTGPVIAADHARDPASSTGARIGRTRSGQQRLADPQPGRERPVDHAGRRQADGGEERGHDGQPGGAQVDAEEEGEPGPQHDLEDGQLRRRPRPPCPRRRRPGRCPRAAGRRGSPRPTRWRSCAGWPARSRTARPARTARVRPRAGRSSDGPRAKANRTRTSTAKGSTCHSATRERTSMRRSLPATSSASRHIDVTRLARP